MSSTPSPSPPASHGARQPSKAGSILLWSVALTGLGPFLLARNQMSSGLALVVGWHILGGLVITLALPLSVRSFFVSAPPRARVSAVLSLIVCALSGALIVLMAAAGRSAMRAPTALSTHVGTGILLTLLLLLPRAARAWDALRRARPSPAGAAAALLILSGGSLAAYSYRADSYFRAITATNAAQARNPLFPAGAILAGGPWSDAQPPERCGYSRCHPAALQEWAASRHALATSGGGYADALRYTESRIGEQGARWCAGCHAPLAPVRQGPAIGCLGCHAAASVPEPTGNGRAIYRPPEAYPFSLASGWRRYLHDMLVRVRPFPHAASLTADWEGSGTEEICVSCHRMGVNTPQNRYHFVRYDDTWQSWQESAYSGESVHCFSEPGARSRTCAGCHLSSGSDGSLHDHRCLSVGSSSRQEPLARVEIFALRRPTAEPGGAERLDAPLATHPVTLSPGDVASVDVLVESLGIGHAFPTGIPDIGQLWLEMTLVDGQRSRGYGPHHYGLQAIDRAGRVVPATKIVDMVARLSTPSAGYGQSPSPGYTCLLPGAGDVARYRISIPRTAAGSITLRARLLYRRSSLQQPGAAPRALAQDSITLPLRVPGRIAAAAAARSGIGRDDPRQAPRFYSYGAALLQQGDAPRARRAFQQALALAPGNPEYETAVGRTFLQEGDLLAARAHLQQAADLSGGSPRAVAWLGRVYRLMGQYESALRALQPVADRYGADPQTWFDIGQAQFRSGRMEPAIQAFTRMLDIDPDDPSAHFGLAQCYRRLRRLAEARREETLYQALRDEEPPSIMEAYRRRYPAEAREALAMHEHVLR